MSNETTTTGAVALKTAPVKETTTVQLAVEVVLVAEFKASLVSEATKMVKNFNGDILPLEEKPYDRLFAFINTKKRSFTKFGGKINLSHVAFPKVGDVLKDSLVYEHMAKTKEKVGDGHVYYDHNRMIWYRGGELNAQQREVIYTTLAPVVVKTEAVIELPKK